MATELELAALRHEVFARDVIAPAIWPDSCPLDAAAWQPADQVPHDTAAAATYRPVEPGWRWGPAWSTAWFRLTGRVPESMAGKTVAVRFSCGTEATWWLDGAPRHGFDRNRDAAILLDPAHGAEAVDVLIEAACNHPFGITAFDWDPPEVRHRWHSPTPGVLERCELAVFDADAWRLWVAWDFARRLVTELPADGLAARRLVAALDETHRGLADHDVAAGAIDAVTRIEAMLAKTAGPATTCLAVGHAHIDTAWLWPLRETRRKCLRTFANVLELIRRDPGFRFVCSQAQQYAWVEADAPTLFEAIRARVGEGRWEPAGAMWVEPDCNVPCGESLIRQILHGTAYWRDRFGDDAPQRMLFLPDTFGFPAALPQIMAGSGLDTFVTNKLSWCQVNEFPHVSFRWRGLDGTEVLAHCTPGHDYNAANLPHELARGERNAVHHDRGRTAVWLQPFGYGDGGGGPTAEMIRRARLAASAPGLPHVRLAGTAEFCDALHRARRELRARGRDLPVWDGEPYLELHRGTFTTHGRLKAANHHAEQALRAAEWLTFAGPGRKPAGEEAAAQLDHLWKLTLLNQFHDILPGSSIGPVYADAHAQHAEIAAGTDQLIEAAVQAWAAAAGTTGMQRPMLVLNPSSSPRSGVVECDGEPQAVRNVPALGASVIDRDAALSVEPVRADERSIDNGVVRLAIDDAGRIVELRAAGGRDACRRRPDGSAEPINQLVLYEDRPRQWEAWDIDAEHADKAWPVETPAESIRVVEPGPLRAAIEVMRPLGRDSRITQTYVLDAGSPLVEIRSRVEWREARRLLRALFPVDVRARFATHGTQLGHLQRPAHRNTSWEAARFEFCAHGWLDLAEPGSGVAVLAAAKYGWSIDGHVMGLSLLRGPRMPDPTADVGDHDFTYAVMPHGGDWRAAGVDRHAEHLGAPMIVRRLDPNTKGTITERWSPFTIETQGSAGVIVTALKRAESGDQMILRLVETRGGRGRVTVRWHLPVTDVRAVDLLERTTAEGGLPHDAHAPATTIDVAPFRIVTLAARLEG